MSAPSARCRCRHRRGAVWREGFVVGARGVRACRPWRRRVPRRHQARRRPQLPAVRGVVVVNGDGRRSRPATRTSCCSSGRPTSCWTERSSSPRRVVPATSRCACRTGATTWPPPSAAAMAERPAHSMRPYPRSLVRPPDRFVAGEESALAAWLESGASLPAFRPDKGNAAAHRPPIRARAQCRDARPRGHDRPDRPRRLPRPRPRRGPGHLPRHDLGHGREPRGGGGRPGHAPDRHRQAGHAAPGTPGTPRRRVRRRLGRAGALRDALRVTLAPRHRFERRCRRRDRPRPRRVRPHGVGTRRALPRGPERRTVRSLRLRPAGHRRRHGPARPGSASTSHLMARLDRRLREVNGRGACRHPDGAVQLVRSALSVFAADVRAHADGAPCAHVDRPTQLRFPSLLGTGGA